MVGMLGMALVLMRFNIQGAFTSFQSMCAFILSHPVVTRCGGALLFGTNTERKPKDQMCEKSCGCDSGGGSEFFFFVPAAMNYMRGIRDVARNVLGRMSLLRPIKYIFW